jgi:hypothetical protein
VEVLQIPFEGVWLPGYFLQPAGADARARKTVVLLTGFDGTGEELYFQTGQSALERGWNVLIAEGPGQVGALRFHPNLVFRPDYEVPVGAVIDYASRGPRSISSGSRSTASASAATSHRAPPPMTRASRRWWPIRRSRTCTPTWWASLATRLRPIRRP